MTMGTLDSYEKIKELGRGAFGVATLYKSKTGGRFNLRVIKQVDLTQLAQTQRETAHKEVGVLRQLFHPHIVGFLDTFLEDVSLYIVMEYADGGELSRQIKQRQEDDDPYKDDEALKIFAQCLQALRFMHNKRIIHRDIKSQNIFLMSSGNVKIGDLGIAKVMESTTAVAGTVIGTPSYFAPEICEDKPYNSKVDIWSIGVVLYELLALCLPFQASNVAALVMKIIGAEPKPLPERVGSAASDVVKSTLQKNPDDRPSAEDMLKLKEIYCHVTLESESSSMEQYEELETLGRGAFGSAIKVKPRYAGPGVLRVIKTIDLKRMSASAKKGAQAEVSLLRRLHFPHIIAYYDAFVENDILHIVLEYADAGDLCRAIEKRKEEDDPYTENDALKLFAQCLLALHYIHSKSIIHRDIKSQNVFLMKNGDAKLGDFGISKVMDETVAEPTAMVGTPSYLPPEMCRNLKYDSKVDIWSLGVLLYELLSLKQPFQCSNIAATIMKIVNDEPAPLPSRCSEEIGGVVTRMLQKKAEIRPSAEELLLLPLVSACVGSRADLLATGATKSLEATGGGIGQTEMTWDSDIFDTEFSEGTLMPTSPATKSAAELLEDNLFDSIDGGPKHPLPEMDPGVTISTADPDSTVAPDSLLTLAPGSAPEEPTLIGDALKQEMEASLEDGELGSTLKDPALQTTVPEDPKPESPEEALKRQRREAKEEKNRQFEEEQRQFKEELANSGLKIWGAPSSDSISNKTETAPGKPLKGRPRDSAKSHSGTSELPPAAQAKSPMDFSEVPPAGQDAEEPEVSEVEQFILDNGIDDRAAESFRVASADVQQAVLARGGLKDFKNPSAALVSRIQDEAFQEEQKRYREEGGLVWGSPAPSPDARDGHSATRRKNKEQRAHEQAAEQRAENAAIRRRLKQQAQGTGYVVGSEKLQDQQRDALDVVMGEAGRRPPSRESQGSSRRIPTSTAESAVPHPGTPSRPITGAGAGIVAGRASHSLSRPSTQEGAPGTPGAGRSAASSRAGTGMNDPVRRR